MNSPNRLHALCPYFAMFPESFAESMVREYSAEGDWVLDPFCGRGTTPLVAIESGRKAAAIDINPVAFCVSSAKCSPPSESALQTRIDDLEGHFTQSRIEELRVERRNLPTYFGRAFHRDTLAQLLFLRSTLDWRQDGVDRFLAALVLGTLHGEMGRSKRYLSNQMPRTISPKPAYSLKYWRTNRLWARKKDVFSRLRDEAEFRLKSGAVTGVSAVVQGDARNAAELLPESLRGQVALVLTSPPYFDTTNFEEDQWLRLWFLGGASTTTYRTVSQDDRHRSLGRYWDFLADAWAGLSTLVNESSILVCRIAGRSLGIEELGSGLRESLRKTFPDVSPMNIGAATPLRRRQTEAFRPGTTGVGKEVDFIYRLGRAQPHQT